MHTNANIGTQPELNGSSPVTECTAGYPRDLPLKQCYPVYCSKRALLSKMERAELFQAEINGRLITALGRIFARE